MVALTNTPTRIIEAGIVSRASGLRPHAARLLLLQNMNPIMSGRSAAMAAMFALSRMPHTLIAGSLSAHVGMDVIVGEFGRVYKRLEGFSGIFLFHESLADEETVVSY